MELPDRARPIEVVTECVVDAPLERVWEFHQSTRHLPLLHTRGPAVRLLRHAERVAVGGEFWVIFEPLPLLPVTLGFRHHVLEPLARFGETAIHGPFETFVHVHEFERAGAGTRVRDRIELLLPIWLGGRLVTRVTADRLVSAMFVERARALGELCREGRI
jgi:ligand-binding SRPBCC domain-containing protein